MFVGADVRDWLPPLAKVKIVFAFPPCTDVAVSGARWFKDKGLTALIRSLQLFDAAVRLAELTEAPYLIENPVRAVSTHWRKPDFRFDPCEYGGWLNPPGDAYTKKTCLWTGNGFVMPKPKKGSSTGRQQNAPVGTVAPASKPAFCHTERVCPSGFRRQRLSNILRNTDQTSSSVSLN